MYIPNLCPREQQGTPKPYQWQWDWHCRERTEVDRKASSRAITNGHSKLFQKGNKKLINSYHETKRFLKICAQSEVSENCQNANISIPTEGPL